MLGLAKKDRAKIKETIENDILSLKEQIAELEERVKPISPDCGLGRLNNALLRIDKPMFGVCIECEEHIGVGRMSVRPESVRCVECAN